MYAGRNTFPLLVVLPLLAMSLQARLMWERLHFSDAEIHALYKNLEFRKMYHLERHLYMLNEYGRKPQTEMDRLRKALEKRIA
jgi:hypothetical protein